MAEPHCSEAESKTIKRYDGTLDTIGHLFEEGFDPNATYYGVAQTNRALFTLSLVPDLDHAAAREFVTRALETSREISEMAHESHLILQPPPSPAVSLRTYPPLDAPKACYPAVQLAVIVATQIHDGMDKIANRLKEALTRMNGHMDSVPVQFTNLAVSLHKNPFDSRIVATAGRQRNVTAGSYNYMIGYGAHMGGPSDTVVADCRGIVDEIFRYKKVKQSPEEPRQKYFLDRIWSDRLFPPFLALGLFGFAGGNEGKLVTEIGKRLLPPDTSVPCKWAISTPGAWIHQAVDFTTAPQEVNQLVLRVRNVALQVWEQRRIEPELGS